MPKRCVIYARLSSDDTTEDRLDRQEAACLEYANSHGWQVVDILREDAKTSGAILRTPALNKVYDLTENGMVDVVLARDTTRLSRDEIRAFSFYRDMAKSNVEVDFVWQSFEGASGELLKKFVSIMDAEERRNIVNRLRAGRVDRLKEGSAFTTYCPLGYNNFKVGNIYQFEIIEIEKEIVLTIFKKYLESDMSLHRVARYLNDSKIPTYAELRDTNFIQDRNNHYLWSASSVRKILTNKAYTGQWERKENGIIYTIEVPRIVDNDTFEAAQIKLKNMSKLRPGNRKYNHLLTGIITCHCGSKMTCLSVENGKYRYYCCKNKYKQVKATGCKQANIDANWLDNVVWQWIVEQLGDEELFTQKLLKHYSKQREHSEPIQLAIDSKEKLLNQLDTRHDKLVNALIDSQGLAKDKINKKLAEIEQEINKTRLEIFTLRSELPKKKQDYNFVMADSEFSYQDKIDYFREMSIAINLLSDDSIADIMGYAARDEILDLIADNKNDFDIVGELLKEYDGLGLFEASPVCEIQFLSIREVIFVNRYGV